jgi:predicted acyl esterase
LVRPSPNGFPKPRPGDQAADDEASLVFEQPGHSEDLEIVGVPRLMVTVVSDRPA